jgi:uncharacterized protein (DUF1800 family)
MDATQHQRTIQHLFWRAGFGASPAEVQEALSKSRRQLVKSLFHDSHQYESFEMVKAEPRIALKTAKRLIKPDANNREEMREQLKGLIQEKRETIGNLNAAWVARMGQGQGVFREKMTLFWHNHFACRSKLATFIQQQNNTLRTHALGKFGDLLMAVSKDAAMLQFLNNQQNRKKSPNENFAREVMELFTLGRGNYTETDIKEAARAFTGWGFNLQGEFVFRQLFHDDGTKTLFGKSGNFQGEDVIDMLLSNPQTARFISTKLYRYFVNERVNEEYVADMAKRFFRSDYDIADLMEYVFTSDWFYDSTNIGAQIKSPVELLAGMQRTLKMDFADKIPVLYTQKVLGQILFNPPNVAGWPGGKAWIDSSSLLTRMQLPKVLFRNETLNVSVKDSGDANEETVKRKNKFEVTMDWGLFAQAFDKVPEENLGKIVASHLIQVPINSLLLKTIENQVTSKERPERIKQLTIALMGLPEYQVC